ncbi:EF-hand domain-containing protein [Nonomuraea sp. NPDC049714]|jgi:Ca2+-binding EF-hand superfamily protein|uniref:EF-hand domain-containing protein n=1 Tax=unclassified Nonomuraea TaxID=2593643 RepID=UPI0037947690
MSDYAITFDLIDTDKDGRISAVELVRLMEVLGRPITLDAAQEGVRRLDRDGDGLIDVTELGTFLQP